MRSLCVVLLTACLIGLAGPGSLSATDSSPTPGLWINPELGLATPEDAAARYKAPFHTWLVDHWKEPEEPDWRRQIFFRFIRYGDGPELEGPRLSRKVASCAVMRTAYTNHFGFGGFGDLSRLRALVQVGIIATVHHSDHLWPNVVFGELPCHGAANDHGGMGLVFTC